MTDAELKEQVHALAKRCGPARNQQAVASVLLGLLGAMHSRREIELMNHNARFAENEIKRLSASRN